MSTLTELIKESLEGKLSDQIRASLEADNQMNEATDEVVSKLAGDKAQFMNVIGFYKPGSLANKIVKDFFSRYRNMIVEKELTKYYNKRCNDTDTRIRAVDSRYKTYTDNIGFGLTFDEYLKKAKAMSVYYVKCAENQYLCYIITNVEWVAPEWSWGNTTGAAKYIILFAFTCIIDNTGKLIGYIDNDSTLSTYEKLYIKPDKKICGPNTRNFLLTVKKLFASIKKSRNAISDTIKVTKV